MMIDLKICTIFKAFHYYIYYKTITRIKLKEKKNLGVKKKKLSKCIKKKKKWSMVDGVRFKRLRSMFFLDLFEILFFENLRRSTLVADCFCCCDIYIYIINDVVASSAFYRITLCKRRRPDRSRVLLKTRSPFHRNEQIFFVQLLIRSVA